MKQYEKPMLVKVELVSDQAVLGNCKTDKGVSGPVGGGDCREGLGIQCATYGS